jgi:hypothetical protein
MGGDWYAKREELVPHAKEEYVGVDVARGYQSAIPSLVSMSSSGNLHVLTLQFQRRLLHNNSGESVCSSCNR